MGSISQTTLMTRLYEPTTAHEAFTFLKQLIQDLGLVISAEQ